MITRRFLLSFAVAALAVLNAGRGEASTDGAKAFVQGLGEEAVAAMSAGTSADHRRAKLAAVVERGLDIDSLGRFALGSFLRQSNPKRLQDYLGSFRKYVMAFYPDMLAKLEVKTFQITQVKEINSATAQIITRVGYGADTSEVGWYVKEVSPGVYKVQDAQIEGYSLRSFQRAKFEKILRDKWIDGLIGLINGWVKQGREDPYF